MSAPRLTFLYPHIFKSTLLHEARQNPYLICARPKHVHRAGFSTTRRRREEPYAQRYGKAQEPQIPPRGLQMPSKPSEDKTLAGAIKKEVKAPVKQEDRKADRPPPKEAEKAADPIKERESSISRGEAISTALQDPGKRASELNASSSPPKITTPPKQESTTAKSLATVLEMPAPTVETPGAHKTPHLQAPQYVHHFDTYTLVKDLENGGFTDAQSTTIMKAVRGLLATNLDMASDALVWKSDVENETYLFRAACSELRTEILNLRKSSSTKTHTQLSHLQHTYDILSQHVSQETLSLRDDLKGMLNDRRMASRMQSQSRDSEISELNYKISVVLGSGSKSEVEGLRWVLTRRAALAIGIMAVLILGSLRYSSYKMHEAEMESRKAVGRGEGRGEGFTVLSREMGTQTEGRESGSGSGSGSGSEAVVGKGESVGYVSLG